MDKVIREGPLCREFERGWIYGTVRVYLNIIYIMFLKSVMKKMLFLIVYFSLLLIPLKSQDFFPVEHLRKYTIKRDVTSYWHGGGFSTFTYYHNIDSIHTVKLNNQNYFLYYGLRFLGADEIDTLRFDSTANKLVIYKPSYDSAFTVIDFNLPGGASGISDLFDSPVSYTMYREVQFILGQNREVISPSVNVYGFYMVFIEGIGLVYSAQTEWAPLIETEYHRRFLNAIFDNWIYNPVTVQFDSTNAMRDRHLDEFPFMMYVYPGVANPVQIDTFAVEFRIFRNDTLRAVKNFNIRSDSNKAEIKIFPDELLKGDVLKYRIMYKDHSIFHNEKTFPDTGYYSVRVLDPTGLDDNELIIPGEFILYDAYPNPFNPSAVISYYLPAAREVRIKVFDLTGNETANLLSEFQGAGYHTVKFDANNLASGIYFYRIVAGEYSGSGKLLLIK